MDLPPNDPVLVVIIFVIVVIYKLVKPPGGF
jgi:hypothetical protein